jgi:hypothetical protein
MVRRKTQPPQDSCGRDCGKYLSKRGLWSGYGGFGWNEFIPRHFPLCMPITSEDRAGKTAIASATALQVTFVLEF